MQNRDFFLDKKQKTKIFQLISLSLIELRGSADMFIMTPLRDLQVFLPKALGEFFSALSHHAILNPITAAFSILGAIPFILRLFIKSEVNNLGKVLDHLKRDFGIEFDKTNPDDRQKLEKIFNEKLIARHLYHLRANIVFNEKKGKLNLKFKYLDAIPEFFEAHWEEVKDYPLLGLMRKIIFSGKKDNKNTHAKLKEEFETSDEGKAQESVEEQPLGDIDTLRRIFDLKSDNDLTQEDTAALLEIFKRKGKENQLNDFLKEIRQCGLFDDRELGILILIWRMYGCFLNDKEEFDYTMTLKQSRENFLKKLNELTAAQIGSHAFDIVNDLTYNFWIGYFFNDLMQGGNDDMSIWPYMDQVILFIVISAVAIGQAGLRLGHYLINKENPEKVPVNKNDKYSNRPLKHQLLEEFVIEQIADKKIIELKNVVDENNINIKKYQLAQSSLARDIEVTRILEEKIEADKENELILSHTPKKFILHPTPIFKKLDFLTEIYDNAKSKIKERALTITTNAIGLAIFVSFVGWFVGAALMGAGIAAGAIILSNPVTVGLVILGAFFGATYLADYYINKDKEKEADIAKQLAENKDKINYLKTLEHQNDQLKKLLENESIQPLTIAEPDDDRFYRRLTSQKTPILTRIKQVGNRFLLGVGTAGTGILIARLAILPLLAASVAGGPVGLGIALTLGVIWAVVSVAKYHHDRKIAESQRILDDLDNRILTAEKNQQIYLQQLKFDRRPNTQDQPIKLTKSAPVNIPCNSNIVDFNQRSQKKLTGSFLGKPCPRKKTEEFNEEHPMEAVRFSGYQSLSAAGKKNSA